MNNPPLVGVFQLDQTPGSPKNACGDKSTFVVYETK
jgi:hypothetical protein